MAKKILVVDNDKIWLDFMNDLLSEDGHEVMLAEGGIAALDILNTFTPDIIFVDLIMDSMDGKKLCKIIRSREELKNVYLIILSSIAAEDKIDFTSFGADACVAKIPFTEIEPHIRAVVDRSNIPLAKRSPESVFGIDKLDKRGIIEELLSIKRHSEIVLSKMSEGILEIDSGGKIVYANSAALMMTKVSEEKLLGSKLAELFTDKVQKQLEKILRVLGTQEKRIGKDTPLQLNEFQITLDILPINEKGVFALVIIRDITERKIAEEAIKSAYDELEVRVKRRTEELALANDELHAEVNVRIRVENELRKAKDEWERTFNAIEDIVTITDTDMNIVNLNRAAAQALGMNPEDVKGKKCFKLFQGIPKQCEFCPGKDTLRDEKTHTDEVEYGKLGGMFQVTTSPVYKDKNNFVGIVHVAKDITEHKRLEDRLRQAEKMEAIGTLAGGIAHDFNNILWIISGNTELISSQVPKDSPAQINLEQLENACQRARNMVAQILSFSRQTGHEKKTLTISSVVKECLKFLRSSIPTTIDIRQKISKGLDPILADLTQINQVIMNLCTNAAHALREKGGVLEVSLSNIYIDEVKSKLYEELSPGNYIKLEVSDTGPGIDPAIIDRIFEPYFTTKDLGEGTGMGLAVVHGIVKSHEGTIKVQSELGKGTSFQLFFPSREDEDIVPESSHFDPTPSGTERILFVDDEELMLEIVIHMLERLGYNVTATSDSRKALELFKENPSSFDLVITDQTMPNLTGAQLAKSIMEIRPEIPVILCTGFSELISEEDAKEMGIKDFILKPVVTSELARSIRKAMDESMETDKEP
ncbi:response regulator [Thermodesulfobacteriota bacterium]